MDLVTQVPRMSKEEFESILNSNMQVGLQRNTLYTIRSFRPPSGKIFVGGDIDV